MNPRPTFSTLAALAMATVTLPGQAAETGVITDISTDGSIVEIDHRELRASGQLRVHGTALGQMSELRRNQRVRYEQDASGMIREIWVEAAAIEDTNRPPGDDTLSNPGNR